MCGICGILGKHDKALIDSFLRKIAHRGMDSEGKFTDEGVSLGVRRLSIIDLEKGDQPIYNEEQDKVIVFNGEIYNYKALREKLVLKGHSFSTESDTETIIHAFEEYGTECFKHLDGAFAIAIYDMEKRELILARDHVGIKPLFFFNSGECFYFSSEMKSFFETDLIPKQIEPKYFIDYEVFDYPLGNSTMFRNIHQLPPGSIFRIRLDRKTGSDILLNSKKYWKNSMAERKGISFPEAVKRVKKQMADSVINRYECSDVGMGVELSGGIDSSLICQVLHNENKGINTYTIDENPYSDDIRFSRYVSGQINSEHREIIVEHEELYKNFPEYIYCIEQLNYRGIFHHILAREISKKNKTVMCGQGSDELFGGYNSVIFNKEYLDFLNSRLNSSFRINHPDKRINHDINQRRKRIQAFLQILSGSNPKKKMLLFEQKSQLQNFMLLVDRALYHGVEVRVPYLKREIIENTNTLPISYKVKDETGKRILRNIASEFGLPTEIISRSKAVGPDCTKSFFDKLENIKIGKKSVPKFTSNALRIAYLAFKEIFIENNGKLSRKLSISDLI